MFAKEKFAEWRALFCSMIRSNEKVKTPEMASTLAEEHPNIEEMEMAQSSSRLDSQVEALKSAPSESRCGTANSISI